MKIIPFFMFIYAKVVEENNSHRSTVLQDETAAPRTRKNKLIYFNRNEGLTWKIYNRSQAWFRKLYGS